MSDVDHLISNAHTLILWNEESGKWQDRSNDHFCAESGGKWRVSARYGFKDGRRDIEFEDGTQAMSFFVNYVYGKHMKLIDEAFEQIRKKAA